MNFPQRPFAWSEAENRVSTSLETSGNEVGVLLGIARRGRPRAPMEVLGHVAVTVDRGVEGDCRGVVKPGGRGRRQLTLMEAGDWQEAMNQIGQTIGWEQRRANLLVGALDLPQHVGARLRIGADVVVRITGECDPCRRMDEIADDLCAALAPDWRGGVLSRVLHGGEIRVGDRIVVEEEA